MNRIEDVKTVQQVINKKYKLRNDVPRIFLNGRYSEKLQSAINHIQSKFMQHPDGRVDPYAKTIKRMWPVTFAHPTGLAIRGTDAYGSGHHGASRGSRTHDGVDYKSRRGQEVKAPLSGKVERISKPYASGIDAKKLSGVEIIASNGTKCWVWYMEPSVHIVGKVVKAGKDSIGIAKTLKNRYKDGITDHVHVRIHKGHGTKINPANVIN